MNVRNWWLRCRADGQQRRVEFGPAAGDGGFYVEVMQRVSGSPELAGRLEGKWLDGVLQLSWTDATTREQRLLFQSER